MGSGRASRSWRKALSAAALAALTVMAVFWWSREEPVTVAVAPVTRGIVQATVANTRAGTVKPCRRARISPAAGGQVARLLVREGDRVDAGQLLMALRNDDVHAQVNLAQAELEAARARSEEVCLRAVDAERESQRVDRLHQRGLAADEARDQATTEAGARAASCRAAQVELTVKEAQIELRRAVLAKTLLRAPFAGIVAEVNPEVGEYVTPSPPGIATLPAVDLIDDSCTYVSAPIDEVDAAAIRPGQAAMIALDAIRDERFPGRVRRVAPYVLDLQKQARTVDVEVEFDDSAQVPILLAGYSADVEIVLQQKGETLRVPSDALLEDNRVLVLMEGVLQERRVETGLANWRHTEVRQGLAAGDLVVTSLAREGVVAGVRARRERPGQ